MLKPTLICCGLFSDRHQLLLSRLERSFRVRLFASCGTWAGKGALPLRQAPIPQSRILAAGRTIVDLLAYAKGSRDATADPEEEKKVVRFLLEQWMTGEHIEHSMRQFHEEEPVAAVIAVNDHLSQNRSVVRWAKRMGIPTFYLKHSFGSPEFVCDALKYHPCHLSVLPIADHVCVDTEVDRQYLDTHFRHVDGTPKIHVIGSTLDGAEGLQPADEPVLSRNDALLVYAPGWIEGNSINDFLLGDYHEHQAFRFFCQLLGEARRRYPDRRLRAVVKRHPTLAQIIGADTSSYYLGYAARHGIGDLEVVDGPMRVWLKNSSLLFTSKFTSSSWDAFLCHVPTFTYLSRARRALLKPGFHSTPTILSQWGLQYMVGEDGDWGRLVFEALEMKWSGSLDSRFQKYEADFRDIPAPAACDKLVELVSESISGRGRERNSGIRSIGLGKGLAVNGVRHEEGMPVAPSRSLRWDHG